MSNGRREMTRTQRRKNSVGREVRPAFSVRSITSWSILILLIGAIVLGITHRSAIYHTLSANAETKTICTVTRVNFTNEIDTSCGRFNWTVSRATAHDAVQPGQTYEFSTKGPRFFPLGLKPRVIEVKQVNEKPHR